MEEARQSVPDLRIIHSDVIAKTRENSRIATERIGAFISVVLTLLGMFSITLLTWYEMKLRRQETGVLLAMGMGAYYVAGLIGIKLLIMGSLGGLFGWVLGSALAYWGAPFLWNLPAEIPVLLLPSLLPITIAAGAVLSCSAGAVVVMSMVFRDPITLLTSTKRK
jgi:ABC-type antimicrobial peptide transport system permease subunit